MAGLIRPLITEVLVAGTWYAVDDKTFEVDAFSIRKDTAGRNYWPPTGASGELGETIVRFSSHGVPHTVPMRAIEGYRGQVYRDPGEALNLL